MADLSLTAAAPIRRAAAELKSPRSLAVTAVLVALNLIINQFSVQLSPMLEITFDFLTVAATGYLCGPWLAGLSGVATDVLGWFMRPNGAFFPGWTLSAILLGIVYGLWLYNREVKLWRIILCKLSTVLIFNFFLTPLWLHILYGEAFTVLTGMRLAKNLVQFPFDVALLYIVLRACERYKKQAR